MPNNRRFSEVGLGLLFLFLGLVALGEGSFFMTLLVLAGIYMLVRQFEGGRMPWESADEAERYIPRRRGQSQPDHDLEFSDYEEAAGRERIYAHAIRAVEEAGLDPETAKVLTTDIGVMAFKDDSEPLIYRSRPVLDDIDYLQPFVQLRLPQKAIGRIRFEIVDSDGQVLFVHEDRHQLERGRNLISPAARLPIHDAQAMYEEWELRVSADGVPLASHHFSWQESATKVVRRHLSEDGEISTELRATMAENRLQKMSLDDLLLDQEEESQNQKQQRR
jgi:hypothetical protein